MESRTNLSCSPDCPHDAGRRSLLRNVGAGAGAAMLLTRLGLHPSDAQAAQSGALGQAQRDALTPSQIIELLKQGNERFLAGRTRNSNFLGQQRVTAKGQYPAAAILSCIDSRAPAEVVFDLGIGDSFNARVAGNITNTDINGSLEFATAAAGAKVVLVLGHTSCGAVAGAIDGVELSNLTALLEVIKPAVEATAYTGDRTGGNAAFVDAVATTNVLRTIDSLRAGSKVLADLEKAGTIRIVGAMYDLATGKVKFLT